MASACVEEIAVRRRRGTYWWMKTPHIFQRSRRTPFPLATSVGRSSRSATREAGRESGIGRAPNHHAATQSTAAILSKSGSSKALSSTDSCFVISIGNRTKSLSGLPHNVRPSTSSTARSFCPTFKLVTLPNLTRLT